MFGQKKILQRIEEEKYMLEKEKQELLFIKEQLSDSMPKINISDLYIWYDKDIYYIVRLEVTDCIGRNFGGVGKMVKGYYSTLTDIFTNKIIYQKCSEDRIGNEEFIREKNLKDSYYAYFYPIYEADRNILAYTDKMVPMYVLQQLYYRLNKVDVNAKILKK